MALKRDKVRPVRVDPRAEEGNAVVVEETFLPPTIAAKSVDEAPPSGLAPTAVVPGATSAEAVALKQALASTTKELERLRAANEEPQRLVAAREEKLRLAEERARKAEDRAQAADERAAEASQALDDERAAHATAIKALERAHADAIDALSTEHARMLGDARRIATMAARADDPEPPRAPVASPHGGGDARPNYYGSSPIKIPEVPAERSERSPAALIFGAMLLVTAGVLGYHFRSDLTQKYNRITSAPKIEGANMQLAQLADVLDNNIGPLPDPSALATYLRENARRADGSDAALDPWGTAFRLDLSPGGYVLRSAGPDRDYDTDDDITLTRTRARK